MVFLGSITSRCSGNEPARETGHERAAEIEPMVFHSLCTLCLTLKLLTITTSNATVN